jgi:hypothetical protein
MAGIVGRCSGCRAEREFERPPCGDGHGGDCPEYACVACGSAVFLGVVPVDSEVPLETRRVA